MSHILNFEDFVNKIYEKHTLNETIRFQELAGMKESKFLSRYAIQISFHYQDDTNLFEHKVYTTFRKTNNRYSFHPENSNIPVKAHYHVFPPNSKKEIYAVNVDGTAHHRANRGYKVPAKEAEELRSLGVQIPQNNIIESFEVLEGNDQQILNESLEENNTYSIFLLIDCD